MDLKIVMAYPYSAGKRNMLCNICKTHAESICRFFYMNSVFMNFRTAAKGTTHKASPQNGSSVHSCLTCSICPRPPNNGTSSGGGSGPRHGNLTPPRISPSCPHCVIPFQGLWLGRSIIVPVRCRRRHWELSQYFQ